jgi:pimeloyl-ACP methyl ester carboxylesterase
MLKKMTRDGIGFTAGHWPLDPTRQTLIFLHGAGQSSAFWDAQVKGLKNGANTIAMDLPGHGRSQGPGQVRIDGYAASILAFVDAIHVQRPLLCGHSMGGALVQKLLIDTQDRFRGAVLANTGAKLRVAPAIFDAIAKDYKGFMAMLPALSLAKRNKRDSKLMDEIRSWPVVAQGITEGDFEACNAFSAMDHLDRIKSPVLVLGAKEDGLTPLKYSQFLANAIADARLVVIEGAGHFTPVEQPQKVNRAIQAFLNEIGA